jgi:hypothetical protein
MRDGKLGCFGAGDMRVLLQNLRAAEGHLLQFVQQRAILRADALSRGCGSAFNKDEWCGRAISSTLIWELNSEYNHLHHPSQTLEST